jgi:hypothetical protein
MRATQGELYKKTDTERAIELISWLRHEIDTMRLRLKAEQLEIMQMDIALRKVQTILFELQQNELFDE